MYETMANDDTAQLMLGKRDINCLEDLEKYLHKNFNVK